MAMGSIKRERGVLKLVHPGRFIEVHRKPIRAEEVMRRNPRHCITRPDVFKFPWIVVKSESPNCLSKTMSPDMDDRSQDSHVELLPKVINYEGTLNKMEQELLEDSIIEFTPYEAVKYYQNYNKDVGTEMLKKDVNSDFVSNERVGMLKSCLRKPDSTRKSLNLKVSFNISI
ncbi:hypothetical protein SESBI_08415 [Sesbania bispinosa]|nr:hypothetical protein SESBI_08415 [Sesbania bispinosa]